MERIEITCNTICSCIWESHCSSNEFIVGGLADKNEDHIERSHKDDERSKRILLWRELKLPVTPYAHLFEDHIVYQMENNVGGLAHKSEDNIERAHQDGKRSIKKYCGLKKIK